MSILGQFKELLWGETNPIFRLRKLLVPKHGQSEDATYSPGARTRRSATSLKNLELIRPNKDAGNELQKLGFDDVRELRNKMQPVTKQAMYASLEQLGVTAAFSRDEKLMEDAQGQLGDDYDFVDDFALSLPCRVHLSEVPENRQRTAPELREWPDVSGVAHAHRRGIRGAGVLVGVLDTGVDADHVEFSHQRINYRYVSLHPNSPLWPPRDVRGFDTDGHGTHCCGIIAGKHIGVAPEAQLYVASVIESETMFTGLTRVAAGLNWLFRHFTRPDNEHLPAVVSMSLGFPMEYKKDDPGETMRYHQRLRVIETLLKTLMQANVLPIVAIGNDGRDKFGYPGGFPDVLAVGAVDFEHQIAEFSGSGVMPTYVGNGPPPREMKKPNVVGYGVGVNSCLERDYGGSPVYQRLNGTSMATPYVAGIAALYRSQFPALTGAEVRNTLQETALRLDDEDRTGFGLARFVEERKAGRPTNKKTASQVPKPDVKPKKKAAPKKKAGKTGKR